MASWSMVVGAAWTALNGFVFLLVGREILRRRLSGEEKRANALFALFWQGLGALSVAMAAFNLLAAFGHRDVALYVVLLYTVLLVLCAALWGLAYYLIYLFTGNARWLVPLAVYYVFYFFLVLYIIVAANPMTLEAERWQTKLVYGRPELMESPTVRAVLLLLTLPQLAGALAYMSLFFRVQGRLQRYRIGLVSLSIVVWFGVSFVASVMQLNQTQWWPLVSRLLGLSAAVTVLLAYSPPAAWRHWLEGGRPASVHRGVAR